MTPIEEMACPALPQRPSDGHKGTFGRVLLVGGSVGMSGSISLSAKAALRAGSGLVTAAIPRAIQPIVAAFEPGFMTLGLACDSDGILQTAAVDQVLQAAHDKDALGVGPGLGLSDPARQLVLSVLTQSRCPVVVDADGLNLLAISGMPVASRRHAPCVLTPHPGEFARLTGLSLQQIGADRDKVAIEYARRHQIVLILKGQGTIVTDGQRLFRNSTGNSGMATGGSGDVLTGMVTSLLGQRMPPLEAAALAVHVHGLAGDLAARELSQRGLIASDLPEFLGKAWLSLERAERQP